MYDSSKNKREGQPLTFAMFSFIFVSVQWNTNIIEHLSESPIKCIIGRTVDSLFRKRPSEGVKNIAIPKYCVKIFVQVSTKC